VTGLARSQVLIREHVTTPGFTDAFVCPPGYITLVKSFSATNNGGTATVRAGLFVGNSAIGITVVFEDELAPGKGTHAEVWTVLNPDDFVYGYVDSSDAVVWVAGAILLGDPQFQPGGTLLKSLVTAAQVPALYAT
jgi:hypothetical protein